MRTRLLRLLRLLPRLLASMLLGLAAALPAAAEIQLAVPPLPAPSPTTALWLTPADIPALQQKRQDPRAQALYAAVKAFVDARLGSGLATRSDDDLTKLAKGAALLHQMGETPASGAFATYRDLAVAALLAVRPRSAPALTSMGGGAIQHDTGRLQSMAEARDLLQGTGVSAAQLTAIEARIANWCDAFLGDFVLPVMDTNLEAKAGAALVTVALALPHDGRAAGWLDTGMQMINTTFLRQLGDTGWYREGPHYTNYTLNNLVPLAWQVKRRTGVDWFPALRPLVACALALRQPPGRQAPYEDAVPLVFPWLHVAAAYAGDPLAEAATWAWQESDQETSNFGIDQLEAATAFLVFDPAIPALPPSGSATMFVDGDAHLHALRGGFERDAITATLITARDSTDLTLIQSRHNLQNPLDLTVCGFGRELLVTGTGGPEITGSANRGIYLAPSSRSTVLIDGTAPFTVDPARVRSDARLDSRDDGAFLNDLLDLARTEVAPYAGAARVRRALGLVGGRYAIVVDEVAAAGDVGMALPWRGRGQRQVLGLGPDRVEVAFASPSTAALPATVLDVVGVATRPLSVAAVSGLYAPTYGQEDTLEVARVEARGSDARFLTVLAPRLANDAPHSVNRLGGGAVAAVEVRTPAGFIDTVAAGAAGSLAALGALGATDGTLALVRIDAGGRLVGAAVVDATTLDVGGTRLLSASTPVTASLATAPQGALLAISIDQGPVALTVGGLPAAAAYRATWNGQPLSAAVRTTAQGLVVEVFAPAGGGSLRLEATAAGGGGGVAPGTGGSSGGAGGGSSGGGGGGCQVGGEPARSGSPWAIPVAALLGLVALRAAARVRRRRRDLARL